jgi:glutamate N-acetyltransferase/amino-acid N-acetyltransferase
MIRTIPGGVTAPIGFRANGVFCGIKKSKRKDLALVASDRPCLAAGVFTTNKVQAACVVFNKKQLLHGRAQAVIVNAGNANCLTGPSGYANTARMAEAAAGELHIEPSGVLVGSTGVIGVPLPIKRILGAIPDLVDGLRKDGSLDAAHAILTTDRIPKEISVEVQIGARPVRIGAIAKGAGMIHPDMELSELRHATMLCYVTTDAAITPVALRLALQRAAARSFNMVSIDADQSTNDMVVALANGAAQNRLIRERTRDFRAFYRGLEAVATHLAKLMVKDAEGATKFVELSVRHASSAADAREIVRTIAASKLVKCALFGSDPNWGRIAAAVGASRAHVDPSRLQIKLGPEIVLKGGSRKKARASSLHRIMSRKNIRVAVDLGLGHYHATGWTCDLSTSYVRINSAYRT